MSRKYSNANVQEGTITLSAPPPIRPAYISKPRVSALTEKERIARKVSASYGGMVGGAFGGLGGNTVRSQSGGGFSVQLSTDFLEKPQSLREQRELFRHFYENDPIVGQAIDIHTELPLSKVRLSKPKPRVAPPGFEDANDYGNYIYTFFKRMVDRLMLLDNLHCGTHHYWLDGNAIFFTEDSVVKVPQSVGHTLTKRVESRITSDGVAEEVEESVWVPKPNCQELELAYYQKKYKGWEKITVIPIDQVVISSQYFNNRSQIDLIPSDVEKDIVFKAEQGDERALEAVGGMAPEIVEGIKASGMIPLGTDPDEGSFAYHLTSCKAADRNRIGLSLLQRCLNDLIYRDKLRQAQTQIASRAMTPKRVIWGENLGPQDVDDLRDQIELALVDPDYSIITNYEIHWEEMGSKDRLLDLGSEYEIVDKRLYSGLGVTESLLSGESTYAGDRIKLEVLNNRYMHYRERIQEFVHRYLFEPVARRKGFVEKDKYGDEVVLYPKLSFTRLALRDSQDTYDALYNLYNKGSVPIEVVLEIFNLDVDDTREKIEADMFTVNDATFNEVIRALYAAAGSSLADKTNVVEKFAKYLKLKINEEAPEDSGRF